MPSNIHVTSGLLLMEPVFVWAACNSESERDNFPCIFNWSTDALLILLFFLLTELSNIKKIGIKHVDSDRYLQLWQI